MILYFLFILIPIVIILCFKKKYITENFWGILPYPHLYRKYNATSLNCTPLQNIYYSPKIIHRTQPLDNYTIKNNMYCYIDNHLNRRCFWSC